MIDCHFHLRVEDSTTEEKRANYADFVRREAEALGIEKFCGIMESGQGLSQPQDLEQTRRENELLGKYVDEHPELFVGWARANPEWGDAAVREFRRAVEEDGLIGYKLWTEYKVNGPKMDPIAEAAIDMGVPVLIHVLYRHEPRPNLPNESFPSDILEFARRFPELDIVEAHISTDDAERRIKNSYRQDNIYLDISGSSCARGTVEKAVDQAGADRVVFGTDNTLIGAVGRLQDADITDRERDTIAYKMNDLLPEWARC